MLIRRLINQLNSHKQILEAFSNTLNQLANREIQFFLDMKIIARWLFIISTTIFIFSKCTTLLHTKLLHIV